MNLMEFHIIVILSASHTCHVSQMAGDERIAANRWDVAIHVFALQLVVDNVVNGPRNPLRLDSVTVCGCRCPVLWDIRSRWDSGFGMGFGRENWWRYTAARRAPCLKSSFGLQFFGSPVRWGLCTSLVFTVIFLESK